MSYCRWSSNDFKCDVYCYEHVDGGFVTHVAGSRYAGTVPHVPSIIKASREVWLEAHKAQREFLDNASLEPIGLPHDGKTFWDDTLEEMRGTLTMLKGVGYTVPDWVFDEIDDEIANATAD